MSDYIFPSRERVPLVLTHGEGQRICTGFTTKRCSTRLIGQFVVTWLCHLARRRPIRRDYLKTSLNHMTQKIEPRTHLLKIFRNKINRALCFSLTLLCFIVVTWIVSGYWVCVSTVDCILTDYSLVIIVHCYLLFGVMKQDTGQNAGHGISRVLSASGWSQYRYHLKIWLSNRRIPCLYSLPSVCCNLSSFLYTSSWFPGCIFVSFKLINMTSRYSNG